MIAPLTANETERLRALHAFQILDTERESEYDDLTRLAGTICRTPIALISLIDPRRQWFKACVGLDATETARDLAFCTHAILGNDLFIVPDATQDARFSDNPLVTGDPHIRFYAGMPLTTPEGHNVGTLCVIDRIPRNLNQEQQDALRILARQVVTQLVMRKQVRDMIEYENRLFVYQSELEHANRKLKTLATTDALTGVKNRGAFNERLTHEFERARRHDHSLSLILLDVDYFKLFNDTFGHPAGDEVLKSVGALLQKTIRNTDFVARFGGEEFAVILPETDYAGAMVLAERCRRAIAGAGWDRRLITVSVGVATLTEETPDPASLVQEADRALYRSKRGGRNRVNHSRDALLDTETKQFCSQ